MRLSFAGLLTFVACAPPDGVDPGTEPGTPPAPADPPDDNPSFVDLSPQLAALVQSSGAPALAGAIVDADGLYALGAAGVRRADRTDRVTPQDRWHLGSDTKAMTGALVATFVDEGQVSFDSTLPELFPDATIDPGWSSVTLRDLLRHRAGVGDIPEDTWEAWWIGGDVEALRRAYVEETLAAAPPAEIGSYVYSNGGYVIAGAALEALTGESWEALLQRRVFTPLGMTGCGFGAPGTGHPEGHDASGIPVLGGDNPPTLGPAGTVHCTLQSWARFAHANAVGPGGGAPLLEPETWTALHDAPLDDYALGWNVTSRDWAGGTVLHHVGSNRLWFAWAWVAPETERAYLAVTNSGNPDHLAQAVDAAIATLIDLDLRR